MNPASAANFEGVLEGAIGYAPRLRCPTQLSLIISICQAHLSILQSTAPESASAMSAKGAPGKRKRKRQPFEDAESDGIGTEVACTATEDEDGLDEDDVDHEDAKPETTRPGKRPDVTECMKDNKKHSFVSVKMSLGSFLTSEGKLLLSFESILVDLNIGLLDAYALLNIHMIRLCGEGLLVPRFEQNFVRQCLTAVMINNGNVRIDPELQRSLELYNSLRDPTAPRGCRAGIKSGWQQCAAREMMTAIQNALEINFLRRFNMALRAQYGIDRNTAYTLVARIIAPEFERTPPGIDDRQRLDNIVNEWRGEVPRRRSGQVDYTAHLLVPLTYRFLQMLEEHDDGVEQRVAAARVTRASAFEVKLIQAEVMKTFTVLPTKQGFGISHLTMDSIGLRELLVRNDVAVPPYGSKWNEVRDVYWRRFFRIDKVETTESGHRKFARDISTDGKSVSIKVRKPKREPSEPNAKDLQVADFDSRWGLDPGKCNLLVATNQDDETVVYSGKEYREDAYITKSSQKHLRWIRDRPDIGAVFESMPTKRSMLLERWREYVTFMTQHLHLLVTFMQHKPYRRNRLRRCFFKKKKLCGLCRKLVRPGERVVVGFGDWSNRDPNGAIKGQPSTPVKKLSLELSKMPNCPVVFIDEFRTNKVHFECQRELSKQYLYRKAAAHVRAVHERRTTYPVYSVLHCRNNGCSGMTVNKDVNASKNMLRLLDCELNGEPRPVAYTRQASI